MEDNNKDNELFNPEEMQSPFDSIKEVDAEGREWCVPRGQVTDMLM